MKRPSLQLIVTFALAQAVAAQEPSQGLLQATASGSTGLTLQSDVKPDASGTWWLASGASLDFSFELPAEPLAGLVVVEQRGTSGAAAGAQIEVRLNGEREMRPASTSEAVLRSELPLLAEHLAEGANELSITNPNDTGSIGVVAVKVSYARSHPQGKGRTRDYLEPLPWEGSGDTQERKPRERKTQPADVEVDLTLLAPLPGQKFGVGDTVFIEWQAEGFPPGSGVSLHYRTGAGQWQPIEGAERLAYNEPTLTGDRGSFAWTPDRPLTEVRIGLGFVEKARRDPIRHVVGGEGGLATIADALALTADGDVIVLRPGTYREEVVLYDDVELIGEDRERCIILSPEMRGIVVAEGVSATISNLTIDGSVREIQDLDDAWGLHVACGKATVRGVTVRNVFYGLVSNWKARVEVSGLLVEDCKNGVFSTRGASTHVEESEFHLSEETDSVGLGVYLGGALDLKDVHVFGREHGTGLQAQDEGSRITARDCTIAGVSSGVTVYDQAKVDLVSVDCSGCQTPANPMTGLYVVGGGQAKARSCTFAKFRNPGVSAMDPGTRVEITQSEIHHNTYDGVLIGGEAEGVVRNCTISDNKHSGIRVCRGGKAEITGNKIERNQSGINATESPGSVTIRSNSASHNRAWGFSAPGADMFGNGGSNNKRGLFRKK